MIATIIPEPSTQVVMRPHQHRVQRQEPLAERGLAVALRLARHLESLDESLVVAERTAQACRSTARGDTIEPLAAQHDRLAEIERRERALEHREQELKRLCVALERTQLKLARGRDSLQRAVARFRAEVREASSTIDARSRQLDDARRAFVEQRRELAREVVHLKGLARAAG